MSNFQSVLKARRGGGAGGVTPIPQARASLSAFLRSEARSPHDRGSVPLLRLILSDSTQPRSTRFMVQTRVRACSTRVHEDVGPPKIGREFGPLTMDGRLLLLLIVIVILISPPHRMLYPMAQSPCRLGLRERLRLRNRLPSARGLHGEKKGEKKCKGERPPPGLWQIGNRWRREGDSNPRYGF